MPSHVYKMVTFVDPDDPEYIRQMRRPAEVKEDIKQMEQRKRVELIMQVGFWRSDLKVIHFWKFVKFAYS